MAFPQSDSHKLLSVEMTRVLQMARTTRADAASRIVLLQSGPTNSEIILQIAEQAQIVRDRFADAASVPGIAAYAAANLSPAKTAAEIGTDFSALLAALDGVVAQVTADFPAGGYLNDPPIVNGVRSLQTYTVAQTATLRTTLQAVVDAIEP